jgi:serine-type D-Ala-D-Ala carboxypeptidase (penicillin-binding protein 5/6)
VTARSSRASALAFLAAALLAAPAQAATPRPPVSAPSAIVVEASTGETVFAKAADTRRSIASTTKLMTALLTLERAKLSDTMTAARYRPLPSESRINLRAGERMQVSDLLRALLLESANDAAATLAEGIAGSRPAFVRLMNARARQLGLRNTHYANPVGLDEPGNYSSARDLAKLTARLQRFSFFTKTVDRQSVTLQTGDVTRTVNNRNTLLSRARWLNGVKTGFTRQARNVLVGSGRRRGIGLVAVVLGEPTKDLRDRETFALLKWGMTRFRREIAVHKLHQFASVPIRYRRGAELPLVAARAVRHTVRRGERLTTRVVGVPSEVAGPIREGQRFGTIVVLRDGRRVGSTPLVARADVAEAGLEQQTKEYATRPFTLLLVVGAIGGCVLAVRLIRRRPRGGRDPVRREPETA